MEFTYKGNDYVANAVKTDKAWSVKICRQPKENVDQATLAEYAIPGNIKRVEAEKIGVELFLKSRGAASG